jgi:hypothetical protein
MPTQRARRCSDATNDANEDRAIALSGTRVYVPVSVKVIGRTEASRGKAPAITFTCAADVTSQQSPEYTIEWGDVTAMWAACPSTLPSSATADDPGPPPALFAEGELLLSEDFIAKHGAIRHDDPKWPKRLGGRNYKSVGIFLTSLIGKGVCVTAGGKYTSGSVNFLDPELALQGQNITTDGRTIKIALTKKGFDRLGVRYKSLKSHEK